MKNKAMTVIGTALAAAAAMLAVATPASAATHKNGVYEQGELGLWYFQNYSGPVFDLYFSDSNFSGDVFPGYSISADNNTESDWNWDVYWWHVFTGANYTGSHGCIAPGTGGNFNSIFKNTVSSAYYSSTC